MMRAARIENGVVKDLWEVPALNCFGAEAQLVEAPEWVMVGATYDGQTFINPLTSLGPLTREQQIIQINQERDAKLAAGFTYNGYLYHSDVIFQSQLQGFLLAWQIGILPTDTTVAIRRKDNVTEHMTQAEVTALAAALLQYVQQVYAESWTMKDALE